ncbi:MAG: HD domain-containing protein, partial [candidate division NC10 bacterium]|nr:HD domain-containing protein [candidate division NC10 bacterium]
VPHYLAPLARRAARSFLVLPIFLKEKLSGTITLGHLDPPDYSQDDLVQARQLADQMAVALSNARLLEELDQLNWGTLTALARAIDAKSPWTAGHSERVTELALKIGRALGLSPHELDILHRGGLLHDIGKIGIPATILDKSAQLTEEEFSLMREHPSKGARILEPIPAYAAVIPIVLEHHEWYDGTGYPDGLAGEAISLGGRIFAVADVFDALSSDRPYRAGLDRREVIEIIKAGAGRQFDSQVVQAFLEVMALEVRESEDQPTSRSVITP